MKKLFYSFIFSLLLFPHFVDASFYVYAEGKESLQVSNRLEVSKNNSNAILDTPKVDETEKIYDFANLFTDSEEETLYREVISYIEKSDMDMVIVTIDDNNKLNASEYAKDFYDYNDFGTNDTFDGILYLIDMDNREVYISTCGYAQLFYDDFRINLMLDDSFYYLSRNEFYQATFQFVQRATDYLQDGIPDSNEDYYIDSSGNMRIKKKANVVVSFVGAFVISSVVLYLFISRHKGIKLAISADDYMDQNSIKYGLTKDTFLTTHTTRVATKSHAGSSGRSGGSSISRGSSGRSHGGGGRRF